MRAQQLAYAIRCEADRIQEVELADSAELLRVLARIVEGNPIDRSFGAPGDWGYGTQIGDGVMAMLEEQATAAKGGAS
jgi:hypothetical protein